MKTVIGFAGHIQSGKDEAAKYVAKYFGFKHDKLAYPIQDMVAMIGGFFKPDYSHRLAFDNREWKETFVVMYDNDGNPVTVRELLKRLGTDLLRNQLKHSIWADILAKNAQFGIYNVVVSDVRYPDELEAIKHIETCNGYLIYIDNPLAQESALRVMNPHASEQHQAYLRDNADYVIVNDQRDIPLSKFRKSVHKVVEDILGVDVYILDEIE